MSDRNDAILGRPDAELTAAELRERNNVVAVLAALASMADAPDRDRLDEREIVRRALTMRAMFEENRRELARRSAEVGDDAGELNEVEEDDEDDEEDWDDEPPDEPWTDEQIATLADRVHARVAAAELPVARWEWDGAVAGGRGLTERVPAPSATVSVGAAVERAARAGCAPWHDLDVAAGPGRELGDAPCERWLVLPPGLPPARQARYVALTVAGDSMAPLLHAGDVVLVRLARRLARDAVAVVRRPDDGYVVKRVGALRARAVELHSLNPAYPPVEVPRDEALVVGTVVGRWSRHPDRLAAGEPDAGA